MKKICQKLVEYISYYIFFLIIAAIIVSNIFTLPVFVTLDWSNIQTLIEVMKVILFWIIGIEFARLLLEYRTALVIELLVFVVARKLLFVEDDFSSVFIGVAIIIALFLVLRFIEKENHNDDQAFYSIVETIRKLPFKSR